MFMNEIKMLIWGIILVHKLNKVLGNRWINIRMKLILINLEKMNMVMISLCLIFEILYIFLSQVIL